ncbi:hypothetical protein V499_05557 [Pseudogymnoascus sp. VKM F-103]|nr:hypothetical protein V499_05557 [Pseudogymnoascus sp. VKM F-103]
MIEGEGAEEERAEEERAEEERAEEERAEEERAEEERAEEERAEEERAEEERAEEERAEEERAEEERAEEERAEEERAEEERAEEERAEEERAEEERAEEERAEEERAEEERAEEERAEEERAEEERAEEERAEEERAEEERAEEERAEEERRKEQRRRRGGNRGADDVEEGGDTPAALAVELAKVLPVIVVVREDDGLSTNSLADGLDSSGLLEWAGAGLTVAVTGGRPSGLEVDTGLAWAELVNDVELALDEGTGILSLGGGVEEGVDVGTDNVNGLAESTLVLLEHVQGLGSGDWASVSGALEDLLGGGDEGSELLGGADTVEDGLVTDDNEDDKVPAAEGGEGGDLRLGALNSGLLDVDTDDQLEAVGLASGRDVLEAVAVSLIGGVEADSGETLGCDILEIGEDSGGVLASTGLVVRSVGDGPLVTVGSETALVNDRLDWLGGRGGLNWGGRGGGWHWELGNRRGVWAVDDVVGLGDGGGDGWLGVGTWDHGGGGWVDEDGGLGHGGGRRGDRVRAGGWADVGGLDDDRGGDAVGGADGGDRAGDGGLGHNNGGNTSVGVGAGWNLGGGGSADGGLLSHGDGRGGDGVGSWLEGGGGWGWERDNWDGHNGDDGLLGGGWDWDRGDAAAGLLGGGWRRVVD